MSSVMFNSQSLSLPVENFDNSVTCQTFKRHSELFGGDCKRGLIVGPSGCGKTNVMLALLLSRNGLRYKNIYLCSKSLYQTKYEFLRDLLKDVPECGFVQCPDVDSLVAPVDVKEYSVIIFDDILPTGHNIIKDYFSYGRHKNVDCFYLCQSYSAIPKQLIRDNCNFLVLFRQDVTNLKHIYDDHVVSDMTFDKFKEICRSCWNQPHDILVVDLDCMKCSGRYRQGFDKFIMF